MSGGWRWVARRKVARRLGEVARCEGGPPPPDLLNRLRAEIPRDQAAAVTGHRPAGASRAARRWLGASQGWPGLASQRALGTLRALPALAALAGKVAVPAMVALLVMAVMAALVGPRVRAHRDEPRLATLAATGGGAIPGATAQRAIAARPAAAAQRATVLPAGTSAQGVMPAGHTAAATAQDPAAAAPGAVRQTEASPPVAGAAAGAAGGSDRPAAANFGAAAKDVTPASAPAPLQPALPASPSAMASRERGAAADRQGWPAPPAPMAPVAPVVEKAKGAAAGSAAKATEKSLPSAPGMQAPAATPPAAGGAPGDGAAGSAEAGSPPAFSAAKVSRAVSSPAPAGSVGSGTMPVEAAPGAARAMGRAQTASAAGMAVPAAVRPLRGSFGARGSTASYLAVRLDLLREGRLPRSGVRVEELGNAFEQAPQAPPGGAPRAVAEGAALPGRPGTFLLRIAISGMPAPQRPSGAEVAFDGALVAGFRRVGASARPGAAAALFELDLTAAALAAAPAAPEAPEAPEAPGNNAADPVIATLRLGGGGAEMAAGPSGPNVQPLLAVRLSHLRRGWQTASPALRLPGLAVQLGEALESRPAARRWRELRASAEQLAGEVPGDRRAAELQRLVERAADLASAAPVP